MARHVTGAVLGQQSVEGEHRQDRDVVEAAVERLPVALARGGCGGTAGVELQRELVRVVVEAEGARQVLASCLIVSPKPGCRQNDNSGK